MRRWIIIAMATVVLSASVAATSGCYGSFSMTRDLHAWNGEVTDNKFINWLLFVGLVIVPVYEVSVLVDGFVFNSIEFWTGSSPVSSDRISVERGAHGELRASMGDRQLELRPTPQGAIDLFEDGEHVGRVIRHDDGSMSIYDADGQLRHRIEADTAAARRAAVAR